MGMSAALTASNYNAYIIQLLNQLLCHSETMLSPYQEQYPRMSTGKLHTSKTGAALACEVLTDQ